MQNLNEVVNETTGKQKINGNGQGEKPVNEDKKETKEKINS